MIEVFYRHIEFQENAEPDPEKRLHPGGSFRSAGPNSADPEKKATTAGRDQTLARYGCPASPCRLRRHGKVILQQLSTPATPPHHHLFFLK
ncbi:hypothetical protein HPP92_029023 [Vanilla planifolia]|uniref:Uncharacterized protein n=1 Tax=Vanilla planifolia TaxID=51239 RepID=A0A835P5U6_VANPL|nr:hypothetical protein HPP92_029011 [Vanilla planifolia]KAG0446074.1 hypothetical protein HPP92_029023 [Vanilla planifolia]